MANSPDLSALSAYAGDYEKKLFSTLVNSLDAVNDVTLISNLKGKMKMTKLRAGDGARPFSSTFEGRGTDLVYTNRDLEASVGKRDLLIDPSKYWSTWMNTQLSPGKNPMEIPFAEYVWQQVMLELAAEINNKTIYYGFDKSTATVYDAGTVYNPGDYITLVAGDGVMDYWKCITLTTAGQSPVTTAAKWVLSNAESIAVGFGKRIATAIASEGLVPVTLGTLDNTHAYDQFTKLWRALPVAYKVKGAIIYTSWDNADLLADDFETKVTKYTEVDIATGKTYLSKTDRKCEIVRATWMTGSNRLICAPKENLLIGTDLLSDLNKIRTVEQLYTLQAGIVYAIGTQIRDIKGLVVSESV